MSSPPCAFLYICSRYGNLNISSFSKKSLILLVLAAFRTATEANQDGTVSLGLRVGPITVQGGGNATQCLQGARELTLCELVL